MSQRCLVFILLLSMSTAASAVEPLLLLVLRMLRDQAISTSIERGVGAMQPPPVSAPSFGYALPLPPVELGTEEQRLRTLMDESFLYLNAAQRDSVFAGMQKILRDPRYEHMKQQIVGEFALKARTIRDSYRVLDKLSYAEKRSLAAQAKDAFSRLPAEERRQLIEILQSGLLPVPRDLSAIMLSELSSILSPADGRPLN